MGWVRSGPQFTPETLHNMACWYDDFSQSFLYIDRSTPSRVPPSISFTEFSPTSPSIIHAISDVQMCLLHDSPHDHDDTFNCKRKLDDCFSEKDFSNSTRMSKISRNVVDTDLYEREEQWRSYCLQFFVKLINGKSLLIRARRSATVLEVMKKVEIKSGIPVSNQRVIYGGRQLYDETILNECRISNDSTLQVVGRMRSSPSCEMWRKVKEINHFMRKLLCSKEHEYRDFDILKSWIDGVMIKFCDYNRIELQQHVTVLIDANFPAQLMKVYLSVESKNQKYAFDCINQILTSSNTRMSDNACFYPLILEFGKMLSTVGYENKLYLYCRRALAQLVFDHCTSTEVMNSLPDILPFVIQTAKKISANLVSQTHDADPSIDDVREFRCFFELLKHVILKHSESRGCFLTPIPNADSDTTNDHALEVTIYLYTVYTDLLAKISSGLQILETDVTPSSKKGHINHKACTQYLPILNLLHSVSKLYLGAEENYRTILSTRKAALSCLVMKYSRSIDDLFWLTELKGLLDFKAKRHLVSMLFPNLQYDYEEMNELLIDRSNLLAESFEYMKHADRDTLHSTLFVEFKNEEATGPGVLREWFIMVCQAIFYTGNPLFTTCPNDRRRFYLNPASTVDPLHPDYLRFCGRVIALALRHNVHVGIVFDRVFFLLLAGTAITLEDIKEADPEFYRSCKQILDMDAEFVDTDALGLTFVREVEEMGSWKVMELCRGGKNKVVNSHNRGEYVKLLISSRFVVSTSKQLQYFTEGFGDILADSLQNRCFFKILDLEDLDLLLQGSATDISVEDWKAHTVYNGYNETDSQIAWFWKIVGEMSAEQQRGLLFFWKSVKYLPPEGFHGLNNRLHLSKVLVSLDRLPTSHTCFHKLCMPAYSSLNMMQARLSVITQEHVGLSFGAY